MAFAYQYDGAFRNIYLKDPGPAPADSWMGQSYGKWEGDTLVIDVTGLDERTWFDRVGDYHSDELHVVERFTLLDGGKTLEAEIRVEDPGAFTTPWTAIQRWRLREGRPVTEVVCAENNFGYYQYDVRPIPTAGKPDF